jgi:pimeloyl-ACP methyl ester carboxylesterase/prenyltransferase beta subunit
MIPRLSLGLLGTVSLLALLGQPTRLLAQTPAEFVRTGAYLASLQNPDGSFSASKGAPGSLSATSSVVRTLGFVRGSIPDVLACIRYLKSCRVPNSGFSATPGGQPEVHVTAVGLMAAADLKVDDATMIQDAIAYFAANAKSFEEVRIAIAGLEAVKTPSPDFPRWLKQIEATRNSKGTYGEGPGEAFASGGAAAAIRRMGMKVENADAIIAAIKAAQRPDGAWSKDDGPTDLSASYRIMRGLFMMGAKPDIPKLRAYIASCRQPDGSYSVRPGGEGTPSGTYYSMIITRWTRLLEGREPVVETAGFRPLFDGESLDGWEGDTSLWSVRDGLLVGRSPGIDHNDFLATAGNHADFALSLQFRLLNGTGNSGVQFRSVRVPPHEMSGYQADIGEGYWGGLYDESRRNKVLVAGDKKAVRSVRKGDWNQYSIRANSKHVTLSLNGKQSVKYDEAEPESKISRTGRIAVQIHAGPALEVQFRDLRIQPLPSPRADDATKPGFHVRTLKTKDFDRKYTVYVPEGYDGRKAFPVVMFLHGSGERGDDGVSSAQVGLGPAILNRPGGWPVIAVFPQAKETWEAHSRDSRAAVAALDDVVKSYKTDPSRIYLTGLSMGGMGSWDLAARSKGRFAALVPVCGSAHTSSLINLTSIPIWGFVGDADSDPLHIGMRITIEILRSLGNTPRYTEYRGVGHNSWDRAYSDPALLEWMLAQHK